ncbi:MAG: hypothetical protein AAF215_26080 [Cyanobacteria bacterium P01_A01_bin.123]
MLSETELLEAFVEASIRGQDTLLANKQFIAESRFGINHLISKKSGLVVKVNVKEQPVQFWIRHDAPNREQLDELLKQQQFLTTGTQSDDGFCGYQYFPAKQGYDLHCQSARVLWRNWRTLYRMHENMAQAQKLLIKGGHDWEQIKKITVANNVMFIETPDGETTSHMDDAIAWLSEVPPARPTQPTEATADSGGFPADGFID